MSSRNQGWPVSQAETQAERTLGGLVDSGTTRTSKEKGKHLGVQSASPVPDLIEATVISKPGS